MRFASLAGIIAFSLALAPLAQAETINYTEGGLFNGSLNGIGFYYTVVSITGTGDTNFVTGSGPYTIGSLTNVTLSVGGVTTTLGGTITLVAQGSEVSFDVDSNPLLTTSSPSLAGYDLQNEINVGLGGGSFASAYFETGEGNLLLNSNPTGTIGFRATFPVVEPPPPTGPVSNTPEPSSIVLTGSGLLALVGQARRRFRRA